MKEIREEEYKVVFGFAFLPEIGCAHCSCKSDRDVQDFDVCCICQRVKSKER